MPAITKDAISDIDALQILEPFDLKVPSATKIAIVKAVVSAITDAAATQAAGVAVARLLYWKGPEYMRPGADVIARTFKEFAPANEGIARFWAEGGPLYTSATTAPAAVPTDLSKRLREFIKQDLMPYPRDVLAAADEIDRLSAIAPSETEAAVELPEKPLYSFIQYGIKYTSYATLDAYATQAVLKDRADRRMK